MYFPYLRGRQYELLALKELANKDLISPSIFPVIELIKITSTLTSTLKTFAEKGLPLALIVNPSVGDLTKNCDHISDLNIYFQDGTSISPGILLNQLAVSANKELIASSIKTDNLVSVLTSRDFVSSYKSLFSSTPPVYTLCSDERTIKREIKSNRILFEDKFNKLAKNADYSGNEFFSDDHLYYDDEGYVGFSDYSIVGSDYSDAGFAPYAVAIHIVYFDDSDILRVAHFVSDSNSDTSDVAGKFYEAVLKLKQWYEQGHEKQLTYALSTLLNHAENGYYPGLPTVKKLSIMHHLELMAKYLNKEF